jgi:hypothetical protein
MSEGTRTPIGEMRIVAPGVIVHRLDSGVNVDGEDAHAVKQATAELAAGKPVVMVVDMRSVAFAGRDARNAFSEGAAGLEIATALVADRGFSERLAGLFMQFSEPNRPVQVFYDESEAVAWAQRQLAEQNA